MDARDGEDTEQLRRKHETAAPEAWSSFAGDVSEKSNRFGEEKQSGTFGMYDNSK